MTKTQKRPLAALLAILLVLGMFAPSASAASGDAKVDMVYGTPVGDTIEITITITASAALSDTFVRIDLINDTGTNPCYLDLVDGSVSVDGTPSGKVSQRTQLYSASDKYWYGSESGFTNILRVALGNFAAGETKTVTFSATIGSNTKGIGLKVANFYEGNVSGNQPTHVASSPVVISIPLIHPVKEDGTKISSNLTSTDNKNYVGDTVEYSITAENTSGGVNSSWKGVTVTDTLPAEVTFVSGSVKIDGNTASVGTSVGQYTYNSSTRTLVAYLGDIAKTSDSTVTFQATIDATASGKTIKNEAEISGTDDGRHSWENPVSLTVEDTGLYVQSSTATSYKVTYKPNGGGGSDIVQSYQQGQTVTVADNSFTMIDNRTFAAWNTAADGSGDWYLVGGTFSMPGNDITLYAQWGFGFTVTKTDADDATKYLQGAKFILYCDDNGIKQYWAEDGGWTTNKDDACVFTTGADGKFTAKIPTYKGDLTGDVVYYLEETSAAAGYALNANPVTSIKAKSSDGSVSGGSSSGSGTSIGGSTGVYILINVAITNSKATTTYTLNVQAKTGGSVDTSVNGSYAEGNIVTITATANSNYTFSGWTTSNGGTFGSTSSASTTFTMPANDVTLTANFTYSGGGGGGGGGGSSVSIVDPVTPLGALETEIHLKYLNGYPDGSVRTDNAITRAEAASIFYRLLKDTYKDGTASATFSDVNSGDWYSLAVSTLADMGVITGYPDGTFRPNQQITRAEFAAIASRFDDLNSSETNAFSDVSSDHWAISYINSAYARGWINGYTDGTFKPDNGITRAEVVKIVNTMLNRNPETLPEGINPYNDLTESHWAYIHILEASVEHDYSRDENEVEYWTAAYGTDGVLIWQAEASGTSGDAS